MNGLDPEKAQCDLASEERVIDFGDGKKVLHYNGGYYEICTKDYLGHFDAEAKKVGMTKNAAK